MSKLNPTKKRLPDEVFDTTQLAGGMGNNAAKETPEQALRRAVMANLLWEDIAYIDGHAVSNEISRLIPLCDPADVYQAALEARQKQKLRHTPLFLAVEMCKYEGYKEFVRPLLPKIITRADMLTDFMALYWKDGKRPLCKQAQYGLADAFHNFDEYQFAKYDRDGAIRLRDVMFLSHPHPRNEEETALFKRIAERTLATPDTWEVALSSGEDKKAAWTRLIETRKLGALALLRNLRNMKEAEVDKRIIEQGLREMYSNMLLPFDFMKAAIEAPEFERQIEEAMIRAYEHLPKLPGRTLMILDVSGSMRQSLSSNSFWYRYDAAIALAIVSVAQCEDFELVVTSGDDDTRICSSEHIHYPKKGFAVSPQIKEANARTGNGGIFTRQCLEWCRQHFADKDFERIIVFTDSQDCDYPNKRTPKPFGKYNYICDVSANLKGVNYKGVWTAEISGFSEHFLTYIASYEGLENKFDNQE